MSVTSHVPLYKFEVVSPKVTFFSLQGGHSHLPPSFIPFSLFLYHTENKIVHATLKMSSSSTNRNNTPAADHVIDMPPPPPYPNAGDEKAELGNVLTRSATVARNHVAIATVSSPPAEILT